MELLEAIPSLKRHLKVVGEKYPKWIPLIKNWKKLEKAYEKRVGFGEYLSSFREECYLSDGFKKTKYGWSK